MRKKSGLLCITLGITALSLISCANNNSSGEQEELKMFEANWESLKDYTFPEWFRDEKFGIFIHWGPYCVPAFNNEWYPRLMYQDSVMWNHLDASKSTPGPHRVYLHHVENYGHPSSFGYKDFIPMFTATNFDANQWMDLFHKAGAKYVVPVAEHHDGFAMYHSSHTRWNSVNMGPKRDILEELCKAADMKGIRFGVSSHYAFNWGYYDHASRFDTGDPSMADLYGPAHERYAPVSEEFIQLWWQRTTEIMDKYQPDIFWFDFGIDRTEFDDWHPKLAATYYNKAIEWDKEVVLQTKNFRYESFPEGTHVLDIERGKLSDIKKYPWQTDTSVGKNSWGYVSDWIGKSASFLIDDLIDIVSKNGNLLLNVGPKSDGTIPEDQQDVLLQIGQWLKINGDAIYGTRPWEVFGEGPTEVKGGFFSEKTFKGFTAEDIRFTKGKNGNLYILALEPPRENRVLVPYLADHSDVHSESVKSVHLLGSDGSVRWSFGDEGLVLEFEDAAHLEHALAFRVEVGD